MSGSTSVAGRPAAQLAPFIDGYRGYRIEGVPPGLHRGLPSTHMTTVITIGEPIRLGAASHRTILGGLQVAPALIAHDGTQEGVAIELTPVGSRAILGLPARALANSCVELDDALGAVGRELWERLQGARSWERRFATIDRLLMRVLRDARPEPALERAWTLLTRPGGRASVSAVARTIGWTRQHFARRFADEFGVSPKLAVRLARFERAQEMLQQTRGFVSIAQVAAACGYYDQAHLTREFTEFAGTPPGRLLAVTRRSAATRPPRDATERGYEPADSAT